MAEKQCTRCKMWLAVEMFYPSKRDKYLSRCRPCQADYAREWRAKRGEAYRAWHRQYRKQHPEKMRAYKAKAKQKDPSCDARYNSRSRRKSPARALLAAAKHRAKIYGIEFSITLADIVIPAECPILKIPFGPNTGRGMGAHADSPSLDRINPRLGYIPGNVQVLSRRANTMKSNASKEELLAFADWVLKEMAA